MNICFVLLKKRREKTKDLLIRSAEEDNSFFVLWKRKTLIENDLNVIIMGKKG